MLTLDGRRRKVLKSHFRALVAFGNQPAAHPVKSITPQGGGVGVLRPG
jgi:hypothetical protein